MHNRRIPFLNNIGFYTKFRKSGFADYESESSNAITFNKNFCADNKFILTRVEKHGKTDYKLNHSGHPYLIRIVGRKEAREKFCNDFIIAAVLRNDYSNIILNSKSDYTLLKYICTFLLLFGKKIVLN